ncbi:Monooxygenase protein [Halorhabdus tiamatea SARL4B]|uniref:Alkyl hydroperoxide reductase subunit C / thiol-specific antioxidant family protein n=1 Tax=Halorhabdus tiamatea SARL4B TaxID=1033806 RepID=F7PIT7_9EURY|nr:redoxin domain-containing protein [Halorhabdus tiamatea]ERJ05428.1 Monooxygenase protein [Halorhabdus tiamatea SARL4B]CCQ33345.1 alkyl hydroperoxide reductase subunit C / thiol-specific antioxidant family protein [Halorhabdus tiamatea SARL4B]
MLSPGEQPPAFTLPAVVEGDVETLSLAEYLGDRIVILAFYPGDFNPACGEESDLEELDLFTMQPDVAVIGVAPDTVFSHRAFAEEYDLAIPLAADTRGEVAEAYGVAFEDDHGQHLAERAVFVVDLDGVVQYAWSSQDLQQVPPAEPIQRAVGEIGGDRAAVSRYRVAHAHYVEGRRTFTSAMGEFEDHDWMVSRSDFQRAREEFTTATDQFATAGRFVDDDRLSDHFERARRKANALWGAADWLADAADAFSSGDGEEGTAYRNDAESPLETARDLAEPLDPDDITVEDDAVNIDPDALADDATTSAMEAIRSELDGEVAGGVDLELGEETIETEDNSDDDPAPEGPDTEAARRMREYAGVGMDIDDPDGAEDDQIADALAAADDGAGTDTEANPENAGGNHDDGEETTAGPNRSPTPDNAAEECAPSNEGEADDAETDVTEEEIEEIAEELQSQNGEDGQS